MVESAEQGVPLRLHLQVPVAQVVALAPVALEVMLTAEDW
jgi:hypothetical protein